MDKHPNELAVKLLIGVIPHGQIQPGGLVHDGPVVGEGVEAPLAVVASHAALPHAAEAHVVGGQVDDGVVDAPAPEGTAAQNPLLNPLAPGEECEIKMSIKSHFMGKS